MREKLMLRFALVAAGSALAISLFGLWQTKQSLTHIADHQLKLEAQNAVLQKKIDETERNAMLAVANEMESLRADLGAPASHQGPPAGAKPYPDELISKIPIPRKKAGEIDVTVPLEVASAVLSTPLGLAAEVPELSPEVKDTKPDGFSLYDIRQGGLAPALGFEKGDVIHSINGKPFRTAAEIQAAWDAGLPKATRFAFEVSRDGKPLKIVVDVAGKP